MVSRSILKPDRRVLRQGDSTDANQTLMNSGLSSFAKRVVDRQCQALQFAEGMSQTEPRRFSVRIQPKIAYGAIDHLLNAFQATKTVMHRQRFGSALCMTDFF